MVLKMPKDPWWKTDNYALDIPIPADLIAASGPTGIAIVPSWDNGSTGRGWGMKSKDGGPTFMELYPKKHFMAGKTILGYNKDMWNFAFIMRSMRVLAIDIDGKNGGIEAAPGFLGNCPPTLAETSKSGTGLHLFYLTPDTWDPAKGFGMFDDFNGVAQGVDIRDTGCVYHHKAQRWNGRPMVALPDHITQQLAAKRKYRIDARAAAVVDTSTMTTDEVLMAHEHLLEELAKQIPVGMRNTTLYAIGAQLAVAEVDGWEDHITKKGEDIGMPDEEVNKIIRNIIAYEMK
jgi:hypothetical protein